MSLRARLTLLISATLAFTLIGFSIVVYATLARVTLNVAEQALAAEGARVSTDKAFSATTLPKPAESVGVPSFYLQLGTRNGEPVARSANLGDYVLPLSPGGLAAVNAGATWSEIVPKDAKRLLVYSQPVSYADGQAVLQVARSLADRDSALGSLRLALIAGTLGAAVIACIAGWALAGAALGPVGRISAGARAIGAERDFTRRLPDAGRRDEVGALATTLNGMLAELQGAHDQVETALLAQRRFVADASHELRTPLTTIRGNLALLDRDPPMREHDRHAALRDTMEETDRMIRLVNNLFLLARADAGQQRLAHVPVALAPLVNVLVRQLHQRAPERIIGVHVPDDLLAMGDTDAIRQILLNLLDNALVHTPPDAVIGVRGSVTDGQARVTVADTGPGLAPEVLPHLFERFYRADEVRSGPGAGLGLAIARTLAEGMGATLTVTSTLGAGSVFALSLPVAQVPAEVPQPAASDSSRLLDV